MYKREDGLKIAPSQFSHVELNLIRRQMLKRGPEKRVCLLAGTIRLNQVKGPLLQHSETTEGGTMRS